MNKTFTVILFITFLAATNCISQEVICEDNNQFSSYFDNGNLQVKGCIINDARVGLWEYYYENGQLKEHGEYQKDTKGGLDKNCGEYFKSIKAGVWKEYYDNGEKKSVGQFAPLALCHQDTSYVEKDGEYDVRITIDIDFLKHDLWKYYDDKGDLIKEETYVNGRLL